MIYIIKSCKSKIYGVNYKILDENFKQLIKSKVNQYFDKESILIELFKLMRLNENLNACYLISKEFFNGEKFKALSKKYFNIDINIKYYKQYMVIEVDDNNNI